MSKTTFLTLLSTFKTLLLVVLMSVFLVGCEFDAESSVLALRCPVCSAAGDRGSDRVPRPTQQLPALLLFVLVAVLFLTPRTQEVFPGSVCFPPVDFCNKNNPSLQAIGRIYSLLKYPNQINTFNVLTYVFLGNCVVK